MQMLRLLMVGALATLGSCANVDSSGGAGGPGGAGGASGMGGMGNTGGSGDATVLPEPVLVADPISFAAEPSDTVDAQLGVATGQVMGVCSDGTCSGGDPADRWSIEPSESGEHRIDLAWASTINDLDLYLTDDLGAPVGESINVGTVPETITTGLTAGRLYIIQVQAFDTNGQTQAYTLQVVRTQ